MAWVDPTDVSAGSVLTASKWNQDVVANTSALYDAIGLWHIETKTVTNVAAISFDGIFTSAFSAYRVVGSYNSLTDAVTHRLRFRASGSDNSTSNYNYKSVRFSSADDNYGTTQQSDRGVGVVELLGSASGTVLHSIAMEIMNPNLATSTMGTSQIVPNVGNNETSAFAFSASTVFDGFSLYVSSGNITGTLSVYGYGPRA